MIIIWIIVSILLFSVIVIIHELWHFGASRIFWVKVDEFWLWIPPRAKKIFTDKKWTLYSLNWLPLWGFVRLRWENSSLLKDKKDEGALINKPIWQQIIIILAGVFMNFLLAWIIFSVLFIIWIKPIWINTKIETELNVKLIPTYEQAIESGLLKKELWIILYPVEWSIAEEAWLKEWDILYKINWVDINTQENLIKVIQKNAWKEMIFSINKEKEIKMIPSEEWKIWSYLSENIKLNKDFKYEYWILNWVKNWFLETYNQSLLTLKWLSMLAWNIFNPETPEEREEAIQQVSWPIWIVDFISSSISEWIIFILIIWAIISINLAIFNLLPIPALDWWRFIFIIINWITNKLFWKKTINENIEWLIHILFFIFLIALSLIIAYNDVSKIINN